MLKKNIILLLYIMIVIVSNEKNKNMIGKGLKIV